MVVIIAAPLQISVSGARGASGRFVQTPAAAASGSATGGPWPRRRGPAARASRRRARAATLDFAQVQISSC